MPEGSEQVALIHTVEDIIRNDAPNDWKDRASISSTIVENCFRNAIPGITDDQLFHLFNLAAQNSEDLH
jgi:hypothetical protein